MLPTSSILYTHSVMKKWRNACNSHYNKYFQEALCILGNQGVTGIFFIHCPFLLLSLCSFYIETGIWNEWMIVSWVWAQVATCPDYPNFDACASQLGENCWAVCPASWSSLAIDSTTHLRNQWLIYDGIIIIFLRWYVVIARSLTYPFKHHAQ